MSESKCQNSKIYKILNSIDDEVYVGSTVESLSRRMAKHRAKCNINPHYKIYEHMAKHGKEHFYIELIALYPCETKEELVAKEGEWIRKIGTLNQKVAGRTSKEWYEDNNDECLKKMAIYRAENRETIRQNEKAHRDDNIEVIRERDRQRYKNDPEKKKAYVKQWRDKNPEYQIEYCKRWRQENSERKKQMDKEYRQIEITCEVCNCEVKKCRWSKHIRTKKHIELMKQKTTELG